MATEIRPSTTFTTNLYLHRLAKEDNEKGIRTFFHKNPEKRHTLLSAVTEGGFTPLHFAAAHNKVFAAHALISLESPINITTTDNVLIDSCWSFEKGSTPLNVALKTAQFSMLVLLRLNGAECAPTLNFCYSQLTELLDADCFIAQKKKEADELVPKLDEALNRYIPTEPLRIIAGYTVRYMIEFFD